MKQLIRTIYFYQTKNRYTIISHEPVKGIPEDMDYGDPPFRQQFKHKIGAINALANHPWNPDFILNEEEKTLLGIKTHKEDSVRLVYDVPPFPTGEEERRGISPDCDLALDLLLNQRPTDTISRIKDISGLEKSL